MIRALLDPSPDALIARRLVVTLGREGAHRAVDALVAKFTNVELSALATHWPMWARPKQMPPPGDWQSWGDLTARGFGKTISKASFITSEVQAGRAPVIIMAAQNLTKTEAVQVEGLIAAAPPWFRPKYEASKQRLVYPNGAIAFAYTPEVPDAIRSENAHLCWMSEIQSWPAATREEAYSNFLFATRVGYARTIWDATPKKRHPILKRLLANAAADPINHHVTRGTMYENPHISDRAIAKMERDYSGTQKGAEEMLGQMLDDDEAALVKQATIEEHRCLLPSHLVRKAIGIDPAVTTSKGSDRTGINLSGLGADGRLYVLRDLSGKHEVEAWASIVIDTYVSEGCDLVVVETNKGGNLLTRNLRADAGARGMTVVVVDDKWRPHRQPNVVFVREIFSRGEKADRARPLATAYQRGRVSHVLGGDFAVLEEILTTWVPEAGQRSPDPLEALVHVAGELLGLASEEIDLTGGFVGIETLAAAITAPIAPGFANIATLLGGSASGGRI